MSSYMLIPEYHFSGLTLHIEDFAFVFFKKVKTKCASGILNFLFVLNSVFFTEITIVKTLLW